MIWKKKDYAPFFPEGGVVWKTVIRLIILMNIKHLFMKYPPGQLNIVYAYLNGLVLYSRYNDLHLRL